MMKLSHTVRHLLICPLTLLTLQIASAARTDSPPPIKQPARNMNIRLIIHGNILTATLYDNPSAQDFFKQLPLNLTLEDYASTEKIAYLPKKLSTLSAPAGFDPSSGDITYYAPWGNLAIFHKDFSYSNGLVSLGRLHSGTELLRARGPIKVLIEAAEE